MRTVRHAPAIALSTRERAVLEAWSGEARSSPRLRLRARIVLRAAQGRTNRTIGAELGVTDTTVGLWRRRFAVHRLEGIRLIAPHPLQPYPLPLKNEERILRATRELPPPPRGRWTARTLARRLGLNHMQVHRVWRKHGLSPGATAVPSARVASEPWVEVVGAFRCPPVTAIVFAFDLTGRAGREPPSWTAADDRAGRGLPLIYAPAPGTGELFWSASRLNETTGDRTTPVADRYDLLIFLRSIELAWSSRVRFHLIVYCPEAGMQRQLRSWLDRRPQFTHEAVTGPDAWPPAVGRFLGKWGPRAVSRSSYRGVEPLVEAFVRQAARGPAAPIGFSWSAVPYRPEGPAPGPARDGSAGPPAA
ncbi:MAG TPA: helix-turn-helix domain-containing protein [Thermoplasmata archaeon]|nr:helix-turn-helix domain-containing protein [Thermoplasmata archaeon]